MTFELAYFWFNLIEGVFWIVLAGGCTYAFFRYRHSAFVNLARFTGAILFAFGVSDFIEIYTNGFIGHDTWLFVWKALCVFALAYSLVWYIRLHKRGETVIHG